ncbi:DsrE/DsrF/TusD sulfur relay family protein [Pseudarthrobacter sp. H2]|uniref:DsrE/DsrF/TusD sulfur relay family protein n=1 Tax=Pseudarthrobacter sp. H2 TaxID=3418415 RepID=UPI003CF4993A
MTTLMIINGAAYGQDTTYNALGLAVALSKRDGVTVQVFLMGDGVTAAMDGQKTPDGYYKLDKMLSAVAAHGGRIGCCGTCMDARGITDALLTGAAKRSTMEDLADWILAAEKVLVF